MLNDVYAEAKSRMKGAIQALDEDLSAIRTGRASPALVEKMLVEYYGSPTPLIQLASIGVPEPRSLLIRPYDPSTLKAIEKAIYKVRSGIAEGRSMATPLMESGVFPTMVGSMIAVGESTGALDAMLAKLPNFTKRRSIAPWKT